MNKLFYIILFSTIVNAGEFENTYTGYLFKVNNKIFISKSSIMSKNEKTIEVDLTSQRIYCFKNIDCSCPTVELSYDSEEKNALHILFKNSQILKKEVKIPMH